MTSIIRSRFQSIVSFAFLLFVVVFPNCKASENECDDTTWNAERLKNTYLVKIGGSCLTDKSQLETLNTTMLYWFSQTLAIVRNQTNHDFIIIHGAGSFGHFTAKEYGFRGILQKSPVTTTTTTTTNTIPPPQMHPHTREGFAKTRNSVQTLNQHVLSSLISNHIPAVGISPFSLGRSCPITDEQIDTYRKALLQSVNHARDAGLVPVLHGDGCIYDNIFAAGIVGGDHLMDWLGMDPTIVQSIFLTDVAGIFTSNPRTDPNATLVTRIHIPRNQDDDTTINNLQNHHQPQNTPPIQSTLDKIDASESHHGHDVTGGLTTKYQVATSLAKRGIPVTVVECGTWDAQQALLGRVFQIGTHVIPI